MTRRLVLLRHGRTAWNAESRFQGHADPALDDVGRGQAYEVAGIVAALRPDLLVTSTLRRAAETAEIVARATGLPVRREPRFKERGLGHWEGRTLAEVEAAYPGEYAEWAAGQDVTRRGGETRDEVAARALAGLGDLPVVDLTVIVTHGAAANALSIALLGLPQRVHLLGPLWNCHWTELYTETPAQVNGASHARDGAVAESGTSRPTGPTWRLRGHNLGAPGTLVPLPSHQVVAEQTSDADA